MKMSKTSKTFAAVLTLTFALNVVVPARAEAGVVFYAIGRYNDDLTRDGKALFQVAGITLFVIGLFTNWKLIVLDDEQNQSVLAKQLNAKFPVLADQPAVTNKFAIALSKISAELFEANPTLDSVNAVLPREQAKAFADELIQTEENAAEIDNLVEQLSQQ